MKFTGLLEDRFNVNLYRRYDKIQIPSTKIQINLKFQKSMTETFEISNLSHGDEFATGHYF
jgi:hypothetical protein